MYLQEQQSNHSCCIRNCDVCDTDLFPWAILIEHVALLEESGSTSTSVRIDTSFIFVLLIVSTQNTPILCTGSHKTNNHVIPSDTLLYIHYTEIIRIIFQWWFRSTALLWQHWTHPAVQMGMLVHWLSQSNSLMMVANLQFSMRRTVPAGHEYL